MQGNLQPITTPGQAKFLRVLEEYMQVRRGDRKELILKKAKSSCVEFFNACKAAAPSRDQIKADVLARGWRVKRKVGAWPLKKGERRGSKGPLNRMRAAAIGQREKAIYFVASGWLPAVWKLGGGGRERLVTVKTPRGRVVIDEPSPDKFRVTVTNSTPGIVYVENKHHILEQGFNAGTKDMLKYLEEKRNGGSGRSVGGTDNPF